MNLKFNELGNKFLLYQFKKYLTYAIEKFQFVPSIATIIVIPKVKP